MNAIENNKRQIIIFFAESTYVVKRILLNIETKQRKENLQYKQISSVKNVRVFAKIKSGIKWHFTS